MQNAHDILLKIDSLLDDLLTIASSLEKLSIEVTSEEEINGLQAKQEQIITELMQLDDELHRNYPEVIDTSSPEKDSIHSKMAKFQNINRKFIENLERGSGIINFE